MDLLGRCANWLVDVNASYDGKVLVAFGHGTFQNAMETILQAPYAPPDPVSIFTRKPGQSHIKRGFPHEVHVRTDL